VGGGVDDSEGYFVEPTVIATTDPRFRTMREELFGPIVTTYVYPEGKWEETLELVDSTAPYGLTGAVFSEEREALIEAEEALRYAAGNFYVNDKPTGAVVGQQPFGGSRASGTNDKAGSMWNLIRWVSPRTIKETFIAPRDYRYPFLGSDGADGRG
jgi:1-pyrroline-5-carboxylate dehydrogenase